MRDTNVHIVEGVIEITRHRDRELIGNSLVKTIAELIYFRNIYLYHLQKKEEPIVLSIGACMASFARAADSVQNSTCIPPELSAGILKCLKTGVLVEVTPNNGVCHEIYPLFHHPEELTGFLIIVHDDEGSRSKTQKLVLGFLKIYENFLSLLDENQRDTLTGLLNRQTFDDQIAKIITNPIKRSAYVHLYEGTSRRIPDESFTYWLAIFDIDNFKRVNDTYGHVYGDEVLILLARLMKTTFRKDDLLFRYGGEEFIVVLKAPAQQDADTALERFRTNVERYSFPQVGQITISVGYIQVTSSDVPVIVFWHADQALYYAKQHGKNRTCYYEDLIARRELQEIPMRIGAIDLFRNTIPKYEQ